ncbi:serine protease grass-like [Armigeres subalbatus]|uniref:serine protease grass-like n=1 Tax=Armigeres subalbatus TaxID=124917 RepID=UPI002ED0989A
MFAFKIVLLSSLVLLVSANKCAVTKEQCVPVRYCPHIQDAIETGSVYRNNSLYEYVWSRTCHEPGQEARVCCEPERTSLGKRCFTTSQQPLEGKCVAPEHCTPIKRYLGLRRRRNAVYDKELAENVCFQNVNDGKNFYCCPDVYVNEPQKSETPKKDEDRVLRVKNAFPPCHDPNDEPGFCVPVRHCDHIHSAFLDQRITHDRKLADFVHASRCKSDASNGNSICCAKPTTKKHIFIRNQKAAKLGLSRCGRIPFTNRILKGNEAGLGQNPWMANLLYQKRGRMVSLCSGSLIHPRYVLTSAHCMQGSLKPIAVRLGEYDTSSNPDCDSNGCAAQTRDYGIAQLIPNENFNGRDSDYDIALVELQQEATLSEGEIYPICLPLTESLLMLKPTKMTVTGWGMTEHQEPSNVLLEADLSIVRRTSFCEGESTCCVRGNHAEGHCRGDSGGPMQAVVPIGKGYRYVLFAVISGGSGVCTVEMKQPGVGVMVGYHLNWILDHMDV